MASRAKSCDHNGSLVDVEKAVGGEHDLAERCEGKMFRILGEERLLLCEKVVQRLKLRRARCLRKESEIKLVQSCPRINAMRGRQSLCQMFRMLNDRFIVEEPQGLRRYRRGSPEIAIRRHRRQIEGR
jgi:hypothetical protein